MSVNVILRGYRETISRYRPLFRSAHAAMDRPYQRLLLRNVAGLFFQAGFKAGIAFAKNPDNERVKLKRWKV